MMGVDLMSMTLSLPWERPPAPGQLATINGFANLWRTLRRGGAWPHGTGRIHAWLQGGSLVVVLASIDHAALVATGDGHVGLLVEAAPWDSVELPRLVRK